MQSYLVGGAVRDKHLGLPICDKDYVVVGATPEILIQQGFQQVGRDFPVFLHPKTHAEYALARTERKKGRGYHGFICDFSPDISLEEDLSRRDLTINAMAEDNNGKLYDPHGGMEDLRLRLLRHVSPAFVDDPLRVLRVARFFARFSPLGFQIAPETLALMQQMSQSGELRYLKGERIWQETQKALACPCPWAYFAVLEKVGALAILFPEWQAFLHQYPKVDEALSQQLQRFYAPIFASTFPTLAKKEMPQALFYFVAMFSHLPKDALLSFGQRVGIQKGWLRFALLYQQLRPSLLQAFKLDAPAILALLQQGDIYRQPERFLSLCTVLRSEQGYLGQDIFLWQLYEQSSQIDVNKIIQAGFKHHAIRHELDRQRLQCIVKNIATK